MRYINSICVISSLMFYYFLLQLTTVLAVFKLLFWNIFDPGTDIDQFGSDQCKPLVLRYFAMFYFALYLLLTVIVLLNTLIAIMNTSIEAFSRKEESSWSLLLRFIGTFFLDRTMENEKNHNLVERSRGSWTVDFPSTPFQYSGNPRSSYFYDGEE